MDGWTFNSKGSPRVPQRSVSYNETVINMLYPVISVFKGSSMRVNNDQCLDIIKKTVFPDMLFTVALLKFLRREICTLEMSCSAEELGRNRQFADEIN